MSGTQEQLRGTSRNLQSIAMFSATLHCSALFLDESCLQKKIAWKSSPVCTWCLLLFQVGSRASSSSEDASLQEKTYRCASSEMCVFGAIGSGASSVVRKAIHIPTHRILALKRINVFEKVGGHALPVPTFPLPIRILLVPLVHF